MPRYRHYRRHHSLNPDLVDHETLQEPPEAKEAFGDDDAILEAARACFQVRSGLMQVLDTGVADNLKRVQDLDQRWRRWWHARLLKTRGTPLTTLFRRNKLSQIEREAVALLLLDRLGMLELGSCSIRALVERLALRRRSSLQCLRVFSEDGRLARAGIIQLEDELEDISEREILIDPALVDQAMSGKQGAAGLLQVADEDELFARILPRLTKILTRRSLTNLEASYGHDNTKSALWRLSRAFRRLTERLILTLAQHPDWRLAKLLARFLKVERLTEECSINNDGSILLLLIGREISDFHNDGRAYTGHRLAAAVADSHDDVSRSVMSLAPDSRLIAEGWAQPCGGHGMILEASPSGLAEVEFELGKTALEELQLERSMRRKRRNGLYDLRKPRLSLDQLVLDEEARESLAMAVVQCQHADVLLGRWGLGDVIPYGRATTLLFHGPPGTGKTAAAEAIAAELGQSLMVVNESEVQNCFVGQTEKGIARVFAEAASANAVLFWDEIDAMLGDREGGKRWEVSQVNVLLQQLEKFEGVCVFATNRRMALDAALERRIALKIAFERPGRAERRKIWDILLPPKLPLARSVDVDVLADHDLSGGEIKNVILNAARLTLKRGRRARVRQADFEAAIRRERDGSWTESGAKAVLGFGS